MVVYVNKKCAYGEGFLFINKKLGNQIHYTTLSALPVAGKKDYYLVGSYKYNNTTEVDCKLIEILYGAEYV